MSNYHQKRVADSLFEEISQIIQFELLDPRLQLISVLDVEVKDNLRQAYVYISVPSDVEISGREVINALHRASGFISQQLTESTRLKRIPRLIFQIDETQQRAARVEELLQQIGANGNPE